MAPSDYACSLWGWDQYFFKLMEAVARHLAHHQWIAFVCRPKPQPNPLPILARALNGLWLRVRSIRQPCWRRGRWKSLT